MKVISAEVEKTYLIEHKGVEYKRKVQQNFTENSDNEIIYWLKFLSSSDKDGVSMQCWDFVKPIPESMTHHIRWLPYFKQMGEDEQILEDIYLQATGEH